MDAQAAATFLLGAEPAAKGRIEPAIVRDDDDAGRLIRPTGIDRLDLLPADASLRGLEVAFHLLDRKKRLAKVADRPLCDYQRIIIDCPPGLTHTSDQILRAADLVVAPVIPAPLSRRALDAVSAHIAEKKGPKVALLPVFAMVDRRRALHKAALAEHPGWPVIPMASIFESMTDRRAPVGTFAPRSSLAVDAVARLWQRVERALVER